ncbi:MAG: 4'-phosphopantetheinyl transferase superfamily protein [Aurantimonas endophytica]|uniref:4'-phosphopantetheinyl transferase family protein n=1 Tax=Aurantimonas endophytica TaxID=1522175 RepID=UPI003002F5B4
MPLPSLPGPLPGQIDVWLGFLADVPATLDPAYERLLDPGERLRHQRYKVEGARREYLVGRAIVRTVLSRYAPTAPADWRFEANQYGRPAIVGAAPGLVFNLSHTRGLAALAVARDCDLGIDVERADRPSATHDLAGRYFSPTEAEFVRAGGAMLAERFFAVWTLKEAYIKARGMGLALPLDGFSYDLAGTEPTITFHDSCPDDPARWRFWRGGVSDTHRLALAVSPGAAGADVQFRRIVPLTGFDESLTPAPVTLDAPAGGRTA